MIGIGRTIIVIKMACDTFGRRTGISLTDFPLTVYIEVFPCEGEVGEVVIEVGRGPGCLIMTDGTVRRVALQFMIRIRRSVVIVEMATDTGVGCVVVISVVAEDALHGDVDMRSFEDIVVIVDREVSGVPVGIRGMTCCTVGGQT